MVSKTDKDNIKSRSLEILQGLGFKNGKMAKNSYAFCCPFHDDKHASLPFVVTGANNGCWKCQACGKKGNDIFSFVAQLYNLDEKRDFPRIYDIAANACNYQSSPDSILKRATKTILQPKPKEMPPTYLNEYADKMATELEQTNLYKYLCCVWAENDVKRVMSLYKVGCGHAINEPQSAYNKSDTWKMNDCPLQIQGIKTACSFPSIDVNGNVHAIKIIPYPINDHQRIKDKNGAQMRWIKPAENKGAYFGTHLLTSDPNKPIAIVESEKTAIIGTLFMPSYIWIATAGASNFEECRDEIAVFKGREIHIFPDADINASGQWKAVAEKLRANGYNIRYRDEIIKQFPIESKIDIADIIIWEMQRR